MNLENLSNSKIFQHVQVPMDWLAIFHSHIMVLPTLSAWTIMELIGAGRMRAGVFAQIRVMAMRVKVIITLYLFQHFISSFILGCTTLEGIACSFPFTYSGVTYNSCMDYYGTDWCWTANDHWGRCSSSC